MPIYSYRCAACGHTKDVLQKVSDPLLTDCPLCGAPRFEKQVTAAGFQLKGSGWYVTDFRGDGKGAKPAAEAADATAPKTDSASGAAAEPAAAKAAEAPAGEAKKAAEPAATAPAAPPPATTS